MAKPDLSKLTGIDLFEYYTSKGDEYASVLNQAYVEISEELFKLLIECERTGKHVVIKEDDRNLIDSPVTITIE